MIIDSNHLPGGFAGTAIKGLCHLYEVGETNATNLSANAGFSTAAATGMIDRAEKLGLIFRGRDPHDRRVTMLGLTEEGRKFVEGLQPKEETAA